VKTSDDPSVDSAASESLNGPFTMFPRCCGTDQGAEGELRVETQRSRRPIKSDPIFDALHHDPRWAVVLRRMNLDE
jgi:hypothetical protein